MLDGASADGAEQAHAASEAESTDGTASSTPHAGPLSPEELRISKDFQESLKKSIRQSPKRQKVEASRRTGFDIQMDRHEAKYVIPVEMIAEIREFIRPFCEADSHSQGDPPHYTITTLQLDSPQFSLHYAKSNEALNRFKLRVRTYGIPGESPVFLEVKRKIRGTVVKSRTRIPFESWNKDLVYSTKITLDFRSRQEETAFLEFIRLTREIGARPVVLIRYEREAHVSRLDHYARLSFDTQLCYQPTDSWDSWGKGGRWFPIDTNIIQNKGNHFSGAVLEIKTLSDTPQWMIDLIINFDLARTGHCKYSNAVWQEALFRGDLALPSYATELLLP